MTKASSSVGYSEEWLGRAIARDGNTVKALREEGFKGQILKVATQSIQGGGSFALTISLDDYEAVISVAAYAGKPIARLFSRVLRKIALQDFFRDAFNNRPMSMDEKRAIFYAEFAKTIDWHQEDRREVYDLISWH